jgi:hypothetical protein
MKARTSALNLADSVCARPVRRAGVDFELSALDDLDGLLSGRRNRHDLVVASLYGFRQVIRSSVASIGGASRSIHSGCFNAVVSIGSFRRRLPVAAKMALTTAGTMAEIPALPVPPGGSELWTMWTSMAGASFMRSIWYVSKFVCSTRPSLRVISP